MSYTGYWFGKARNLFCSRVGYWPGGQVNCCQRLQAPTLINGSAGKYIRDTVVMMLRWMLTLKWLDHFFSNVISFSDAVHLMCNIFVWNWSNTMNVSSALWILMAWCLSTRASVATVLTMHPCVSRCLRVKRYSQTKTWSLVVPSWHIHALVNFMIIFIRPSLDGTYYGMALSVRPTVSTKKHRCKWRIFFKFCTQVCLGVPSINLLFVLSYLIKYAHNSIISDFSIFGIHRVIF